MTSGNAARTNSRAPGALNLACAISFLALILGLALHSVSQGPPAVAEFAPQAQQIKNSEPEQTSQFGAAESGAATPLPSNATPTPTPLTPSSAVLLHCVGDPPRQIEDPQSPPCVPYWHGDNGGATSKGVTRDTITIWVPSDYASQTAPYSLLDRFFNQRFEFYGRSISVIIGSGENCDEPTQRADAATADSERVFATGYYQCDNGFAFHDEAARRGIIAVAGQPLDPSYFAQHAPYLWSYPMDTQAMLANMGEWACGRLAGRNADHAGSPDLTGRARKFGVIVQTDYADEHVDAERVVNSLAACGAAPALFLDNPMSSNADAASASTAILRMENAGVTSIVCVCAYDHLGLGFMRAASDQAYYPEWLINTYLGNDADFVVQTYGAPPEQTAHMFGITVVPRQIAVADEPYYWAACEAGKCPAAVAAFTQFTAAEQYRILLLIASGIQMAGPHLNPEAFAKGLHTTVFPNPDHPNMEGKVGFGGESYSMTIDAAEIWWSNTAPSPYAGEKAGSFCYVDRGARHSLGDWPRGGDPFFGPSCDSGA